MLFSLSLILYAILPPLFRNTVALHTFQRKEHAAYLTMELRGNMSGKISAYFPLLLSSLYKLIVTSLSTY